MTDSIQTETPKRFQCRHIHTEGRRCGSASLRGEEFCYFHHTSRKPVANPRTRRSRQSTFDLPLPEDRGAIQLSIGEVLRRIASNAIDPRRAGLLLYGLQIAALNLPPHKAAKTKPEQESPVLEEIITDPTLGDLAPRAELPHPDAPREDTLTGLLLAALHRGHEEIEAECRAKIEAELAPQPIPSSTHESEPDSEPPSDSEDKPEPATLPNLNFGNLPLPNLVILSGAAESKSLPELVESLSETEETPRLAARRGRSPRSPHNGRGQKTPTARPDRSPSAPHHPPPAAPETSPAY